MSTIRINKSPAKYDKTQFRWPMSSWSREDMCFLLVFPAYVAAYEFLIELTSSVFTSFKDSLWATEF